MPNVKLPDGQVAAFPDGMPQEQIAAAIQKHMAGSAGGSQQAQPGSSGSQQGGGESTLGALWRGFAGYAQEGASALGDAARQIPGEAERLAGDVGRALIPGQGGAQAGGRVVGKVGDIAALASGGFAGPTMPPTGARMSLASQRPIVPGPPRPGIPGQPGPPQAPQLMLPPRRAPVGPGPWTSTGTGMIPPESPGAVTTEGPGPRVRATLNILDAEGRPAGRSPQPPAAGPMVEAGTPEASPLAMAIVKNDPGAIDRQLTRVYRRAVKPGQLPNGSASAIGTQDRNITTAVDQIIANRSNLKLTDDKGVEISGQLPRTLHQFSQAIEQTKEHIFDQYDQMAQQAGGAGVRVPLEPAIKELQKAAMSPEVADLHPNLAADAGRLASVWAERGTLSPKELQKTIQNLNAMRSTPAPTREAVSETTMLQPVVKALRDTLDMTIESSQGPGYQALKRQYGALRGIERNVASAVQREAKNIPGGIGATIGNLAAAEEFLRGIMFFDPKAVGTAAAIKGAQMGLRYLRSPNRAISRMFERRAGQGSMIGLPSSIPSAQRALQGGFAAGRSAEDRRESYEANRRGDLSAVQRSLQP